MSIDSYNQPVKIPVKIVIAG